MARPKPFWLGFGVFFVAAMAAVGVGLARSNHAPVGVQPRPGRHLAIPDLTVGTPCDRAPTMRGTAPVWYLIPDWATLDQQSLEIRTPRGANLACLYSPRGGADGGISEEVRSLETDPSYDRFRIYVGDAVGLEKEIAPTKFLPGTPPERIASFGIVHATYAVTVTVSWPGANTGAQREGEEVARYILFTMRQR